MKNKFFLLSISAFLSSVNISHAADVVYNSPEAPAYNESLIWGGAYIGGQVGYDWAKTTLSSDETRIPNFSQKANGFIGGLYAGYNWELSNAYVLGLEGDVNYSDLSQDATGSVIFNNVPSNTTWNTKVEWEAAIRARFGINYERWLPYISGGVAFAGVKDTLTGSTRGLNGNVVPSGGDSVTNTRVGFTVGAGVDYALTNNLLLRAEYRYSDYGKKDIDDGVESKLTSNNIRLGIAYKF